MSNLPITSREYKLLLNMERFKDRDEGSEGFLNLITFILKKEGGSITEKQNKVNRRYTSYLDTPEQSLRHHGYILRLREEKDEGGKLQINLKYRDSDRYLSAARDLSSPEADGTKFEEDILPPFTSKFSHSSSVENKSKPDLSNIEKVISLFPGLSKLNIAKNTVLQTVNNFTAVEVARKLCKFQFGGSPTIKASLSFWYLTESENDWPLVSEFSFDYDLPNDDLADDRLETYPSEVVEGTNRLFSTLQKQAGWINFNTTTKTDFAFDVL